MSTVPSTIFSFTMIIRDIVSAQIKSRNYWSYANWTADKHPVSIYNHIYIIISTIFCLDPIKIWVADDPAFFDPTTPGTWQQSNITGRNSHNASFPYMLLQIHSLYWNGPTFFKSTRWGANYFAIRQFSLNLCWWYRCSSSTIMDMIFWWWSNLGKGDGFFGRCTWEIHKQIQHMGLWIMMARAWYGKKLVCAGIGR